MTRMTLLVATAALALSLLSAPGQTNTATIKGRIGGAPTESGSSTIKGRIGGAPTDAGAGTLSPNAGRPGLSGDPLTTRGALTPDTKTASFSTNRLAPVAP